MHRDQLLRGPRHHGLVNQSALLRCLLPRQRPGKRAVRNGHGADCSDVENPDLQAGPNSPRSLNSLLRTRGRGRTKRMNPVAVYCVACAAIARPQSIRGVDGAVLDKYFCCTFDVLSRFFCLDTLLPFGLDIGVGIRE